MKYLREIGAIISETGRIVTLVDGEAGHVEFPEELIWDIHKKTPGKIFELAHTHPPGMLKLSSRDNQTLKTWAFALYPYPIRLSVISYDEGSIAFSKKLYLGRLEPKEVWIKRGKGVRIFETILEEEKKFRDPLKWEALLIQRSYEEGGFA